MKALTLFLLLSGFACAAENSSPGADPWSDSQASRVANVVTLMSVTSTMGTTTVPRCRGFEIQVVSGASVRFNSQGGVVTASTGGLALTTGATYSEENEVTTRISAITVDGPTSTIVIVAKY